MVRAFLPLLILFAAGCGAVGRDDEPPARPCTGLGPWTDRGPVQVCLGTAEAVAAPGAPSAAGWCVAGEARSCGDDADCEGEERCRCGLCRVVRCATAAECDGGTTCITALGRCAAACDPAVAASCPPGFVCHLGGCVAACAADADCSHGETCSALAGRCVAVPCAADADCDPGRRCEIQVVAAAVTHPDPVADAAGTWIAAEVRRGGRAEILRFDRDAATRLVAAAGDPLLSPAEPWEGDRVGAPAVAVRDGEWHLFYAGGDDAGIGLAVARAGGLFLRRSDRPVLAPTEPWEAGRVGAPAVWPVEGEMRLLYAGGDGAGIGLALEQPDGTGWRGAGGPVLTASALAVPDRWVDLDAIAEPDVADVAPDGSSVWIVAARGRTVGGGLAAEAAVPDWSLGAVLAAPAERSPALPRFEPSGWGPVVAGRTGVGAAAVRDERAPGARRTAGGWELWYVESGDAARGPRLRLATCP